MKAAASIIREAEVKIANLATTATGDRNYDEAERLLGVARQLGTIAAKLVGTEETSHRATNGDGAQLRTSLAPDRDDTDAGADDEPVFERDGDELVKRGKSKGDTTKTYEHKAPRTSIDVLLRAIRDASNKKGEFRTSRIFPLTGEDGRELPVYQGYLGLRWLRQIGLVDRVARQRYRIDPARDAVSCVQAAWQSLPQR